MATLFANRTEFVAYHMERTLALYWRRKAPPLPPPPAAPSRKRQPVRAVFLNLVEAADTDRPVTAKDVIEATGATKAAVNMAADRLVAEGRLVREKLTGKTHFEYGYRLAPTVEPSP